MGFTGHQRSDEREGRKDLFSRREGASAEPGRATSSRCFFYHGLSAHGRGDGGGHCLSGEVSEAFAPYPAFGGLAGPSNCRREGLDKTKDISLYSNNISQRCG